MYEMSGIFNENIKISLWGYNIETILAEKIETILRRGTFTTRPRDFYDVYILMNTQSYDSKIFKTALKATAEHRGSLKYIEDSYKTIQQISDSQDLRNQWKKYQRQFSYANGIEFDEIIETVEKILNP